MLSDVFSSLQLDGPATGRGGAYTYASIYLAVTRKKAFWGSKPRHFILQPVNSKAVPQFSWVGIEINKEESSAAYT